MFPREPAFCICAEPPYGGDRKEPELLEGMQGEFPGTGERIFSAPALRRRRGVPRSGESEFYIYCGAGDYDVSRQLDVILEAVRSLGIHAEKTGRNDITVDGRKFSGNAFYRTGDGCYHHGTILIRADKENMSRYLNVSKEKLASKGVTSVKSRVANLCEFKPDITLEEVKSALVEAFSKVYGQPAVRMEEGELPQPDIDARTEKLLPGNGNTEGKFPLSMKWRNGFHGAISRYSFMWMKA